jgi:hypothetical protein
MRNRVIALRDDLIDNLSVVALMKRRFHVQESFEK